MLDQFREAVLETFQVPSGAEVLDYEGYLGLDAHDREGDEADVVDARFTTAFLKWLGYTDADWHYNRRPDGSKVPMRPDYRVVIGGVTAFVIEDKSTAIDWGPEHVDQLARYAAGTSGYALWTNARAINMLRFDPQGQPEVLAVATIEELLSGQQLSLDDVGENLTQIYTLLRRERFTGFAELVEKVCEDPDRVPITDEAAIHEFIDGSQAILADMRRAAALQVRSALRTSPERHDRRAEIRAYFEDLFEQLPTRLGLSAGRWQELEPRLDELAVRLGSWDPSEIEALPTGSLSATAKSAFAAFRREAEELNALVRLIDWTYGREVRIESAYRVWADQQPPHAEDPTPERFAEQIAYVLFVRLVLVRVLEDKGILAERVASNGGFRAWRDLVHERFELRADPASEVAEIFGETFLALLFRAVSSYYRHFFQQPIFDWFTPDDFELVRLLAHLNRYSFAEIGADVLGFTYENYVDRFDRSKKGQFLTRPGLVEYMLDVAGYQGRQIIGRKLLDHACGSGTFLLHAVRRLRRQLAEAEAERLSQETGQVWEPEQLLAGDSAERLAYAQRLLDFVRSDIVGLDIDPFPCYLAELNLLLQVLDDVTCLWRAGTETPIDRFLIYNTDSLALPESVLSGSSMTFALALDTLDESWPVKAREGEYAAGFDYVIANPPYVTPKRGGTLRRAQAEPFFAEMLTGDPNLYLFFVRLAAYYLSDNGVACLVNPLTLTGDHSAAGARELVTSGPNRLESFTRFYQATVLFPGVDQWVCVYRFSRGDPERERPAIEVRGGLSESEANTTAPTTIAAEDVLDLTPPPRAAAVPAPSEDWEGPWLLSTDPSTYGVWRAVCDSAVAHLEQLFANLLDGRQGDVNTSTAIRGGFLTDDESPDTLPFYSGGQVRPFEPLAAPERWAEPPATEPGSTGIARTLWDLAHVSEQECGIALQEVANLHIHNRLRATWYERGLDGSFVFGHTVWRYRLIGDRQRGLAVLGVLNSSLLSYMYSMWASNTHIQRGHLLRLPTPDLDHFPESALVQNAEAALAARAAASAALAPAAGRLRGDSYRWDPVALLDSAGIPKINADALELRGDITFEPTNAQRAHRRSDALRTPNHPGLDDVIRRFVRAVPDQRWSVLREGLEVPAPEALGQWQARVTEMTEAVEAELALARTARAAIDEEIFEWYAIPSGELRNAVIRDLPWEYANARGLDRTAVDSEPAEDGEQE